MTISRCSDLATLFLREWPSPAQLEQLHFREDPKVNFGGPSGAVGTGVVTADLRQLFRRVSAVEGRQVQPRWLANC
jgi:hypothetical protein